MALPLSVEDPTLGCTTKFWPLPELLLITTCCFIGFEAARSEDFGLISNGFCAAGACSTKGPEGLEGPEGPEGPDGPEGPEGAEGIGEG